MTGTSSKTVSTRCFANPQPGVWAITTAGERFCIRNSGCSVVVEGVGDHGCEYMTNGKVVILGAAGRNFGAGMSGGIAYVLDEAANRSMIDCDPFNDAAEQADIRAFIERHVEYTNSPKGKWVLDNWEQMVPKSSRSSPRS